MSWWLGEHPFGEFPGLIIFLGCSIGLYGLSFLFGVIYFLHPTVFVNVEVVWPSAFMAFAGL